MRWTAAGALLSRSIWGVSCDTRVHTPAADRGGIAIGCVVEADGRIGQSMYPCHCLPMTPAHLLTEFALGASVPNLSSVLESCTRCCENREQLCRKNRPRASR